MRRVLILDRNDLRDNKKLEFIENLSADDFVIPNHTPELPGDLATMTLIIFKCSLEKKIKVFKNRYGRTGTFDMKYLNTLLIGDNT